MKVGPKSSLRPFLHRALQLLLGKGSQGGEGDGKSASKEGFILLEAIVCNLVKVRHLTILCFTFLVYFM